MSKPLTGLKALAAAGLTVERDGPLVTVRPQHADSLPAEVLLPADHPLDTKALTQLAAFAQVRHPKGGRVLQAFATPDFHPGSHVPIGCVLATTKDMIVPQAIGTDINCGMRLHVADLDVDWLLHKKKEWLKPIKSDLLMGTRDLPMSLPQIRAMFSSGPLGWLEETKKDPRGMLARADLTQLQAELEKSFGFGSADGDIAFAPEDMLPDREEVRDCFMGTIGGGNHFVEFQIIEEILDRKTAFQWGIKEGQIAVMAHSGSRRVGIVVGQTWMAHAKKSWPAGKPYPDNGIFALHGEDAASYLVAMNTAANYAAVNRLLLIEMVRDRLRQTFGDLALPLVFDAPHNTVTLEHGAYVHRKGATPAYQGDPVLIPGSMGQSSYLMVGHGNPRYRQSASHGAGRSRSRRQMHKMDKDSLGLEGVECITLKEERIVQEAPAAYKDIGPVVQVQAEAGIASPVARMCPILTFKG